MPTPIRPGSSSLPVSPPALPSRLPAPSAPAVATAAPADSFTPAVVSLGAVEERLSQMTPREKAQLLLMGYGDVNSPPATGSIIVNQTHLTADGAARLARALRTADARRGVPTLVSADQEGGKVNRLKNFPGMAKLTFPSPGQMAKLTLSQIQAEGEKTGRALAAAGVNLLLGPVLDMAGPGTLMDRQGRSFGASAEEVSAKAAAFVQGLKKANPSLAVVGKHFPGYNVPGNSDIAVVTDRSEKDVLLSRTAPFFSVPGLDGVMVSSIRYPALDTEPACFSAKVIDLFRSTHPEAVVMTDDLYASALLSPEVGAYKEYTVLAGRAKKDAAGKQALATHLRRHPRLADPAERARLSNQATLEVKANAQKALLAGADVLLMMDNAKAKAAVDGLVELVDRDPKAKAQLEASARRVMLLSLRAGPKPPRPVS